MEGEDVLKLSYTAKVEDNEKLLKNVAKKHLLLSNRLFNKLKLEKHIYINKREAFANDVIKTGDIITVDLDYKEEDNTIPQKGDLEILYEDDWYIAVNKPASMVVHPCSYHPNNTLANYIKYYLNNDKKIRPVNRLDNGTSGIVLFAKNEYAQELFKNTKEVTKEYIAIVEGKLDIKEGTIDAPIARKEGSIIERCVDFDKGQRAITHYKVIEESNDTSKVLVNLETGRTHQIRVHFAYIGHPLVGDSLYNKKYFDQKDKSNQELHAYRLRFKHPITSNCVNIMCEKY